MRVTCQTIDEFIQTLESEGNENIFRATIRVNSIRRPVDGTKHDCSAFDCLIQASAIVDMGEEGQYLLEAGEECGRDYVDASQEFEGSTIMKELRDKISMFCTFNKLRLLPGLIDM